MATSKERQARLDSGRRVTMATASLSKSRALSLFGRRDHKDWAALWRPT